MTDLIAELAQSEKKRFDTVHIVLFVLLASIISTLLVVLLLRVYLFPSTFTPVVLSQHQEQVLKRKLSLVGLRDLAPDTPQPGLQQLEPDAYSEIGATREIVFSEKEVNALIANNTDLAQKFAIDLSDQLISAKLLVALDEDFPIMGGKTLKLNAGVEMAYQAGTPIVILKGVTIMGVPVPNAWLGNLKNIDLVQTYGHDQGFWKSFAEGVEHLQIKEGQLIIKLKE